MHVTSIINNEALCVLMFGFVLFVVKQDPFLIPHVFLININY